MPTNLVVIKRDGTKTEPVMVQTQAERYLGNVVEANCLANLKQSLNQAFDGGGKATGTYRYDNNPILHASSGKQGTSKCVSLFYYVTGSTIYMVAMGRHTAGSAYSLDHYGQPSGDFKEGANISL